MPTTPSPQVCCSRKCFFRLWACFFFAPAVGRAPHRPPRQAYPQQATKQRVPADSDRPPDNTRQHKRQAAGCAASSPPRDERPGHGRRARYSHAAHSLCMPRVPHSPPQPPRKQDKKTAATPTPAPHACGRRRTCRCSTAGAAMRATSGRRSAARRRRGAALAALVAAPIFFSSFAPNSPSPWGHRPLWRRRAPPDVDGSAHGAAARCPL